MAMLMTTAAELADQIRQKCLAVPNYSGLKYAAFVWGINTLSSEYNDITTGAVAILCREFFVECFFGDYFTSLHLYKKQDSRDVSEPMS